MALLTYVMRIIRGYVWFAVSALIISGGLWFVLMAISEQHIHEEWFVRLVVMTSIAFVFSGVLFHATALVGVLCAMILVPLDILATTRKVRTHQKQI